MGKILVKNLEAVLETRGVFILIEFLDHENTKSLVSKHLKAQKKLINA